MAAPIVVKVPFDVCVSSNTTQAEVVAVKIRGAEGKRVHVIIVDARDRTVSEYTVENANAVEHQTT